jgi:hypothetical protein
MRLSVKKAEYPICNEAIHDQPFGKKKTFAHLRPASIPGDDR